MFDLMCNAIFFASYGNYFGLNNITIGLFDVLLAYIVTIIVSIVVALVLKLPLLPGKPYRYSFDVSAIYPTPIIAIGILSALFVKYLFDFVFPKPLDGDEGEDM